MFVESHPSKDVTLECVLNLYRLKRRTVADLTLKAIGVETSNPSEAEASQNFCGKPGFMSAQKSCEGMHAPGPIRSPNQTKILFHSLEVSKKENIALVTFCSKPVFNTYNVLLNVLNNDNFLLND